MTAAALEAKRILLGEDDPALCELFSAALSLDGYIVESCADGASSLSRVALLHPAILVIDSDLPPTGGLEVVQQLRKKGNLIPIIVISGTAHEQVRKACQSWPQVKHLRKPFSLQELLNAIALAGQY